MSANKAGAQTVLLGSVPCGDALSFLHQNTWSPPQMQQLSLLGERDTDAQTSPGDVHPSENHLVGRLWVSSAAASGGLSREVRQGLGSTANVAHLNRGSR